MTSENSHWENFDRDTECKQFIRVNTNIKFMR